jgi:mono/diheme cytochrome c family protein
MRRTTRIAAIGMLAVSCLLAIGITATGNWPIVLGPRARALTGVKFEKTRARLDRGRYLAEGVLGCFDCHSQRDWTLEGAPAIPATKGGGAVFPDEDVPGRIVAPNISPDRETGAGTWTDDMFARAIREGIGHDGRALFPIMPCQSFRNLSDEDLASVIVYVRSIPPVRNELPKTEIAFPVNLLIRDVPRPISSAVTVPEFSDQAQRGGYMVRLAGCAICHTPSVKGQPIAGLAFAGGSRIVGPWGEVSSANLTPDPSGIPYFDEAMFLKTIRTGHVGARPLSPVMPWQVYRNMNDEDLKSIFAYLKTLKPVSHKLDNGEPATF